MGKNNHYIFFIFCFNCISTVYRSKPPGLVCKTPWTFICSFVGKYPMHNMPPSQPFPLLTWPVEGFSFKQPEVISEIQPEPSPHLLMDHHKCPWIVKLFQLYSPQVIGKDDLCSTFRQKNIKNARDLGVFTHYLSHNALDQFKGPSLESNQAPFVNNEWHNQRGLWASIVRWLNGEKIAGEKVSSAAVLVSCCEGNYDDSGGIWTQMFACHHLFQSGPRERDTAFTGRD